MPLNLILIFQRDWVNNYMSFWCMYMILHVHWYVLILVYITDHEIEAVLKYSDFLICLPNPMVLTFDRIVSMRRFGQMLTLWCLDRNKENFWISRKQMYLSLSPNCWRDNTTSLTMGRSAIVFPDNVPARGEKMEMNLEGFFLS